MDTINYRIFVVLSVVLLLLLVIFLTYRCCFKNLNDRVKVLECEKQMLEEKAGKLEAEMLNPLNVDAMLSQCNEALDNIVGAFDPGTKTGNFLQDILNKVVALTKLVEQSVSDFVKVESDDQEQQDTLFKSEDMQVSDVLLVSDNACCNQPAS